MQQGYRECCERGEAHPQDMNVGGVPARIPILDPARNGVLQLVNHCCFAAQKAQAFVVLYLQHCTVLSVAAQTPISAVQMVFDGVQMLLHIACMHVVIQALLQPVQNSCWLKAAFRKNMSVEPALLRKRAEDSKECCSSVAFCL